MFRTGQVLLTALVVIVPALGAQAASGDEWLRRPVDDRTFEGFLQFFTYDRSVPFEARSGVQDEFQGVRREHLTFQSTPGELVTARIYRVSGSSAGAGWVVMLHGGTGAGKDGPAYRAIAALVARAGLNVLTLDLQYFGERRTGLLTQYTEAEKHDRLYNQQATYLAWVSQTVKDVGRAVDYLVAERGADPARVGLFGISRGGQLAYIVGAAEQRLSAVVASSSGHFDAHETGHLPAACPANYVGRISPRPLLLVNGVRDEDYARATSAEPLHRLARDPKQVLWFESGHSLPDEAYSQIALWLAERLKAR
jgi:uncharacterized protein